MKSNVAIIGAGAIGTKHAKGATAAGGKIGWVVDVDRKRAEALATEYGSRATVDPQVAFSDASIDGVVISVPNCYHKAMAVSAMQHGKHVLLEKPMALNEGECREINQVARATNSLLQLAFIHRYSGVGRMAKQIVEAGTLGDIYHAKAHLHFRRNVPGLGGWFTTKRFSGGGSLIDLGVHLIDLAMHVLDYPPVESVHGQVYGSFGSPIKEYVFEHMWAGPPDLQGVFDVEDSAHALIRFQGGATLDLHVAWAGNFPVASMPKSMMGFFGRRGGITFELSGDHVMQTYEKGGAVVDQRKSVRETDVIRDQWSDFLTSMKTLRPQGPTGEEGQIVQSIIDAVYRSSVTFAPDSSA